MKLASLTTSDLKHIAKLLDQKEALVAQLQQVEQQLEAYESGKPAKGRPAGKRGGARRARGGKRSKRGALKQQVIEVLQAAGKEGATVKEIAAKVGVKTGNVYTWFYSTGKTVKEIKKIGDARYRWE